MGITEGCVPNHLDGLICQDHFFGLIIIESIRSFSLGVRLRFVILLTWWTVIVHQLIFKTTRITGTIVPIVLQACETAMIVLQACWIIAIVLQACETVTIILQACETITIALQTHKIVTIIHH